MGESGIMFSVTCSILLFFFSLFYTEVNSTKNVPAALWNIKGESLHSYPVSAFEENTKKYMDNLLKEILEKESTSMLIFLIDRLSLEDFSVEHFSATSNNTLHHLVRFLDVHPHVFLPSVEEPVKCLHDVNCGIEKAYLDKIVNEKFFQSVSQALDRQCVVIFRLLGSEIMKADSVGEFFKPLLTTTKKNVVGMFSASKSSWDDSKKERRARNLLSADESSDNNFVNIGNCSILYAENSTVSFGQSANNTLDLVFPPNTSESSCGNVTSTLVLAFPDEKESKSIVLRMVFNRTVSGWRLIESALKMDDEEEVELSYEGLEAAEGFSFSCGKFVLESKNSTKFVSVTMNSFQVQPFDVDGAFADSFDCVPYFTLPIWMGLFVSILFILILNTGIYALFSVKTMDRFDDIKGKTISISPAVD